MRTRTVPRPATGIAHHRHSPLRNLVRAASWHRRKLAVLAAVAAVLTGLAAAAPPAPDTTPVVRARVALAGGVVLAADDLEVVQLPRADLPDRAVTAIDELVGRRLAAPLPRHQVLAETAVTSVAVAVGLGHVLAPVRLSDADLVALLRPGDVVDVIAAAGPSTVADGGGGRTSTVARAVRVVTVPAPREDESGTTTGALVVLDVPGDDVEPLAAAAATGTLTVVWT